MSSANSVNGKRKAVRNFLVSILDHWPAWFLLPLVLLFVVLPFVAILDPLLFVLLALFLWPVAIVILIPLVPLGPLGRLLSFVSLSPVPLGQITPPIDQSETVLVAQRFASGSIGTGLCSARKGFHVTLTDRRLTVGFATLLPRVCLFEVALSQIGEAGPNDWHWGAGDHSFAFSFDYAGRSACFFFVPRNVERWVQACKEAGLPLPPQNASASALPGNNR